MNIIEFELTLNWGYRIIYVIIRQQIYTFNNEFQIYPLQ